MCSVAVTKSVPDEDPGDRGDAMINLSADFNVTVAGETPMCEDRIAVGTVAVEVAPNVALFDAEREAALLDGSDTKKGHAAPRPKGFVCVTSTVECIVSNPT